MEWILVNSYQIPDLLYYLDNLSHYRRSPSVPSVRTELSYCYGSLSTAWSAFASWQVCGPLYSACCPGHVWARLPQEKLLALQNLFGSWLPWKWCNRHELQSLIGDLHHAAKVVWLGQTFLHCMIDLFCCFRSRDHPIHFNQEFHLDLLWWHQFFEDWDCVSFWLFPGLLPEADVEVSSNAAGSFGYGAYMKGHWFAGSWACTLTGAAIHCLQGALPHSPCSSCLGTPLGQETYPFPL